jgi:hypothetical protein
MSLFGSDPSDASALAEEVFLAMMHRARELGIDAGDTAALLALDLVARLVVNGRARLPVVLDAIAAAAPTRVALLRAARRRNERPAPLSVARLDPLVLDEARLN